MLSWDPAAQTDNPIHSTQVKGMLRGYVNHAASLDKKGAVPLTEAEIHTMLSSIKHMLDQTASHEQQLLLRDDLLFSILWQTCFRGCNAGSIRLDNIALPKPLWLALLLTVGQKLYSSWMV